MVALQTALHETYGCGVYYAGSLRRLAVLGMEVLRSYHARIKEGK